jgi:zinc protease
LLGTYLQMVDGPFNVADVIKTLVIDLVPLSSFEHLVETTRTITPTRLRELARQYLNKEDMWEVVVGDF